jgi:hypothetical protein
MELGDIIEAKVVAIGADNNSFVFPLNEKKIAEKPIKPIIVKKRLHMNAIYKIKIVYDTPSFSIGEAIEEKDESKSSDQND